MRFWILIITAFLSGCVSDITVRLSSYADAEPPSEQARLAEVKVNDLRQPGVAASKREAAFGTPMGNITFDPPEAQLVKNALEIELTRLLRERGTQERQVFSCDIVEFGVTTKATVLYWDVIGRIHLVLKKDDKQYDLRGSQTERTYVWPGEAIIKRVVEQSLGQATANLKEIVQSL